MTNAAQAKQQTTNDYFLSIPHRLLRADGFVSRTTGKMFNLSLIQLAIFQWMKGCYDSYTVKERGRYHESQENIAKACRVSREVVIRAMKLFEEHGYLIKERKWEGCDWILPYTLEVVSEEVQEHAEKGLNKPVEAFSSECNAVVAPTPENASKEFIEKNSKDIPSVDVEEKPTHAVARTFKLNINRPAASTAPAAHLQECIPDGYYDEHCRREYDFLGMETDERSPF